MPYLHPKVTRHEKPDWLKIKINHNKHYAQIAQIVRHNNLNTICSSGMCPNRSECWSRRTATFMIMGDICTRRCKFCATATGRPLPLEETEPSRVAEAIRLMGLRHCVVTSVTRDDLPDGGAAHWAHTITEIKKANPDTTVEVLIPDMNGDREQLDTIIAAGADIIGHNIETVERLTSEARSKARYRLSLDVLSYISGKGAVAKSGLMLGLGETEEEVLSTLRDLRESGCSIATMGQYLQPTTENLAVAEYIHPDKFEWYRQQALDMGFKYVESGPLVRSSYMAEKAMQSCK